MRTFICVARKLSGSLGFILPKEVVEAEGIEEDQEIVVTVRKKRTMRRLFGRFENWKRSSQSMKDEMRQVWS